MSAPGSRLTAFAEPHQEGLTAKDRVVVARFMVFFLSSLAGSFRMAVRVHVRFDGRLNRRRTVKMTRTATDSMCRTSENRMHQQCDCGDMTNRKQRE